MSDDERFKYSDFKEVFGDLQSVHGVRQNKSENLVVLGATLFLFLLGIGTFIGSESYWTIPFCVLPSFLPVCLIVWSIFSNKNDELRIYQNGFTYKSRKKLQTCLWEQIKTYNLRPGEQRETREIEQAIFPLESVEKKNGELIGFAPALRGTNDIAGHYQDFLKIQKAAKRKSKTKINSSGAG